MSLQFLCLCEQSKTAQENLFLEKLMYCGLALTPTTELYAAVHDHDMPAPVNISTNLSELVLRYKTQSSAQDTDTSTVKYRTMRTLYRGGGGGVVHKESS